MAIQFANVLGATKLMEYCSDYAGALSI